LVKVACAATGPADEHSSAGDVPIQEKPEELRFFMFGRATRAKEGAKLW
jgi:hypothetical protein